MKSFSVQLSLYFIGLSLLGSTLLQLSGNQLNFIESIFTAVSASTLTGLTVSNIGELNLFGQITLLLLIQFGALGIIRFLTKDILGIKEIILLSLSIELLGIFGLFLVWSPDDFGNWQDQLYYSVFHSISAFGHSGFTLFKDSFMNVNAYVQLMISTIVIISGLGLFTIKEILYPQFVRDRILNYKTWSRPTQLSIYSSIILISSASITFYFFDFSGSTPNGFLNIVKSIFHSSVIRSAGFYSSAVKDLSSMSMLLAMILMLVGTSQHGIGGGWRINNILNPNRWKVIGISLAVIVFASGLMWLIEPQIVFRKLFFETLSAISSNGWSQGITQQLSDISRIIVICLMLIGRIGFITVINRTK